MRSTLLPQLLLTCVSGTRVLSEKDCPKAWTNRILVLNVVHGPPGDDNFSSPPKKMTIFFPRMRRNRWKLLEKLKKAVSRKNLGSGWGYMLFSRQRDVFLYCCDIHLRFRGCPVLLHIELSVSARYQKTSVQLRAQRLLLVAAASGSVCGINFKLTRNQSEAEDRFWTNQNTKR